MVRGKKARIEQNFIMEMPLKPNVEDLADALLFSAMSKEQLEFLLKDASYMEMGRGETLYTDAGIDHCLYSLMTGRIKISLTATSGNERIVDIILPGQVFGESAFFLKRDIPVNVQAITASRLVAMSGHRLQKALQQWPSLSLFFLELAHARIQSLLEGMYACCLRNAEQRVNDYLMQKAEPLATDTMQAVVNLPANKSVVASSLNLTPETFSRQLHELEKNGVVRVDRRSVHIFDLRDIRKRCIS